MKRYLIPILTTILVLASALIAGCNNTTSPSEVETYLNQVLPVTQQYAEDTATVTRTVEGLGLLGENIAEWLAAQPRPRIVGLSSLTVDEIIKSFTTRTQLPNDLRQELVAYNQTLNELLERIKCDLTTIQGLTVPVVAGSFQSSLLRSLQNEQQALSALLNYYTSESLLKYGVAGDEKELEQGNLLHLQAETAWLEARLALIDLKPSSEQ